MTIEWDKVLPSVIGALTGGTMSLLGSYFSARRQANKEEIRRAYEERKAEKIALNSVKHEIEFNRKFYSRYKELMNKKGEKGLDFSQGKAGLLIKYDKWEKHSDIIENIAGLTYTHDIQKIYSQIRKDVIYNTLKEEVLDNAIKHIDGLLEKINETLKEY
ncbi:hypothetical protein OCA08_24340 [Bacillus cereus]|nr:hypothetical protein [Bacillus cereus]